MAGLLLIGLPVWAQNALDLDDPQSAHVVFTQDFEQDWEDFKSTKIDEISEIQYYLNTGNENSASFTPWDKPDEWKKGPIRTDSIIDIFNGEMTVVDDAEKAKGEEWGDDKPGAATIVAHIDGEADEFRAFGEADGGGDKYFQFTSDTVIKYNNQSYSSSRKLAARYRRNLFVRLKPGDIEENSSYRLTFFVKAKTLPGHEDYVAVPTVYADVMRGYYHVEKPFSMGYISNDKDTHPYEYSNTFEYTKNNFNDDKNWDNWEKVTFMTYYTTDSIAEYFVFKDGYWWAEAGDWLWKKGSLDKNDVAIENDLRYIVQPDKYFVRLGFPADYTKYSVDNISLTKSWIAGCEYYGDKMRVDFGYKNNLGALVEAEKKKTGVDQLEIDKKYFHVWCLMNDGEGNPLDATNPANYFEMPMRSAEYHADGYMYLFTDFYEFEGEDYSYQFGDYDKVLVSFQNPAEENLQLKYTDTPFPKGNDSLWIKGGKIVPDFVNEIAVPNPTQKIWAGVYSKYDLPPVMTIPPYEDGSFGLEPVSSMEFKFSRKVLFDNKELSEKAIAYVNDERWTISYGANDSILVITRPNGQPLPAGDYTIELIQLFGNGTDEGANVVCHYNFGEISRNIGSLDDLHEFYSAKWDTTLNEDVQCLPEGTALYVNTGNAWSGYKEVFSIGDGSKKDDNCRLYFFPGKYNRAFNLNSRGTDRTGRLFLGVEEGFEINLAKGEYSLNFGVVGINKTKATQVYIYAWDDAWASKPQNLAKVPAADKVLIAEFTPSKAESENIRTSGQELTSLDIMALNFSVSKAGRYVIEFGFNGGTEWSGYSGILLTSPSITATPPVYFNPINALNVSVENAIARINLAEKEAYYAGVALTNLITKKDYYAAGGGFDKAKMTKPTDWAAAKEDLNKATTWVAQRMDTIDALKTKIADAQTKLDGLSDEYKEFDVSEKLQALVDSANAYDIPANIGKDIAALTDLIDKAMTAVDNRKGKNDALAGYIEEGQKLFDAKARVDLDEYQVLSDTLAEALAFDAVKAADEAVDAEALKMFKANTLYEGKVSGLAAMTERNKAFRELAAELEVEEVDFWALNDYVLTTDEDNDEIADIYKAAVKYAIYSLLADDPEAAEDGIDVTPFIKNYMLYATVNTDYVDNTDLQLPGSRNDDKCKGKNNEGKEFMWIKHQWGQAALDNKIWVLMYDSAYATVYPGWTVQSFITGNHSMVKPDPQDDYRHMRFGVTVFDGNLNMDWNSKAQLKQTVTDLPYGYYELAVDTKIDASNDVKSTFSAITKVAEKDSTLSVNVNADGTKTLSIDSITVLDGTLNIDLTIASNDGGSNADNFQLIFLGGHNDVNYEGLVDAALDDLNDKIANRKTFVNAPKAASNRVEFYNAGGQKVNAPQSGLYIKVENGVATKVFVK